MASKTILTHLNLEGNEIQNVSLQKLVIDPSVENLKDGMLWVNNSDGALIKYNDNGAIRTLLWSTGLNSGQTLNGGTVANGNLTLKSTSHATKGSILIPEFNSPGFLKNDGSGKITGGNSLSANDIPSHASSTNAYGAATKTTYGHVSIGDGIAVNNGAISLDVGTGLQLSGTSPNQKITIDSTVATLNGVETFTNKTLTTPTIAKFTNATHNHQNNDGGGTLDHGLALTGLTDDDHSQYLLLAGRVGGQSITGGTASGNNLVFNTTSHTTKGKYVFTDLTASKIVKTNANNELTTANIVYADLDATLFSTDVTLGGTLSSNTVISSQKAIKTYVDNAITGLSWKQSVLVATTTNITLSGTQTIDTVSVPVGSRVLVKNQTDKKTNGIYIVNSGAWVRSEDANTAAELIKATVFVERGTQSHSGWTCSNESITEWTTNIEFMQFSGSGSYTGGTGITITGNNITIDSTVATLTGTQILTNKTLTDNIITSFYQDSGKLNKISFPAVTDTAVTLTATQTLTNKTLTTPTIASFINATHNHQNSAGGGTLTDAVFTSAIGVTKGGTGLSTASLGDILYGSGVNTFSKLEGNKTTTTKMLTQVGNGSASAAPVWSKFEHQQAFGDGVNTDYIITHGLNSRGVKISVWRTIAPYDEVDYYAEKTSTDTITLRFNRVITNNEFSVSISI